MMSLLKLTTLLLTILVPVIDWLVYHSITLLIRVKKGELKALLPSPEYLRSTYSGQNILMRETP